MGYGVCCLDNFSTGKRENIESLLVDPKFKLIEGDIRDLDTCMKACLAPSEAAGEAFNIAYGGQEYLIDIYYKLCELLGKSIEPTFGPDRAGDIKHSNADISKAKRLLGYEPEYDFAKGIELAVGWYRDNL